MSMIWRWTTRVWSTWMWTRNLRFCAGKSASPPAEVLFRKKLQTVCCGLPWRPAWCALAGLGAAWLYHYGEHSWRFRVESSDNIEVTGMQNVTKAQIMEVMGADIGRNIFFIPLAQQKAQLEQIPWVESASVMRFVPNRLKVEIHERTPVAFARVGPRMSLIDAGGTLMELSPEAQIFLPRDSGNESGRAAFDASAAHEDLCGDGAGTGLGRGALFAGPE